MPRWSLKSGGGEGAPFTYIVGGGGRERGRGARAGSGGGASGLRGGARGLGGGRERVQGGRERVWGGRERVQGEVRERVWGGASGIRGGRERVPLKTNSHFLRSTIEEGWKTIIKTNAMDFFTISLKNKIKN